MYKIVVSDLDGTLLDEDHQMSGYTKRIIKRLIDKKNYVFFSNR